jgi:stage II sporulation protein D
MALSPDIQKSLDPNLCVYLNRTFPGLHEISIVTPPGASFQSGDTVIKTENSNSWTISADKDKITLASSDQTYTLFPPVVISNSDAEASIGLCSTVKKTHHYRGNVKISLSFPNNLKKPILQIFNILSLEDYLKGVLPLEIGDNSPIEALKAQAVTARTYALYLMNTHKKSYDLTDDVDTQMYGGMDAEKPACSQAIDDTRGIVMTHNGKLFLSDYYDDCGGLTSPGTSDDDYPPSVVDAPSDGKPDYCANGRYHTWTLSMSITQIAEKLPEKIGSQIGQLKDVQITQVDISGRTVKLELTGDKGTVTMKGYQFRAMIGYNVLRSTLFSISHDENDNYLFIGHGWGHGHGLCQEGAIGMASPPYSMSYIQILLHYFPDSVCINLNTLTQTTS